MLNPVTNYDGTKSSAKFGKTTLAAGLGTSKEHIIQKGSTYGNGTVMDKGGENPALTVLRRFV